MQLFLKKHFLLTIIFILTLVLVLIIYFVFFRAKQYEYFDSGTKIFSVIKPAGYGERHDLTNSYEINTCKGLWILEIDCQYDRVLGFIISRKGDSDYSTNIDNYIQRQNDQYFKNYSGYVKVKFGDTDGYVLSTKDDYLNFYDAVVFKGNYTVNIFGLKNYYSKSLPQEESDKIAATVNFY